MSYHIDTQKNKNNDTWTVNITLNETKAEHVIEFLQTKCIELLQKELK